MIARRRWHFHGRALKSRQPNLTSDTSRSYDKRPRLEALAPQAHIRGTRITGVTYYKCGAGYKRAESMDEGFMGLVTYLCGDGRTRAAAQPSDAEASVTCDDRTAEAIV
jgi:hypothetical protein